MPPPTGLPSLLRLVAVVVAVAMLPVASSAGAVAADQGPGGVDGTGATDGVAGSAVHDDPLDQLFDLFLQVDDDEEDDEDEDDEDEGEEDEEDDEDDENEDEEDEEDEDEEDEEDEDDDDEDDEDEGEDDDPISSLVSALSGDSDDEGSDDGGNDDGPDGDDDAQQGGQEDGEPADDGSGAGADGQDDDGGGSDAVDPSVSADVGDGLLNAPQAETPTQTPVGTTEASERRGFRVENVSVNRSTVTAGEPVLITATVINGWSTTETRDVHLVMFDETVDVRSVTVPSGDARRVTFVRAIHASGTYEVNVGGASTEVTVTAAEEASTAQRRVLFGMADAETPGFTGLTAVLGVLGALLVATALRRS